MTFPRGFVGSAVFNGALWATGGYGRLNSTEILVNGSWAPGPDMPRGMGMDRHCLLALNDSTAFIVGKNASNCYDQ